MKIRSQVTFNFVFAITLFFLLGTPQATLACAPAACCVIHCTPPPVQHCHCDQLCKVSTTGPVKPGEAKITMVSPRKAVIEIPNYVTTKQECEMAVPPIDGILQIDRVSMVDIATKRPLENYSWVPSAAPIEDLSRFAADAGLFLGDQGWQGFVSYAEGPTAAGQLYSFVLDVTLEEGTTSEDLIAALRTQGFIATGSTYPDGTLDFQQVFLRAFGQGKLEIHEGMKPGERERRDHGHN